MSFFVVDAGLDTRLVDLGRPKSRSLGVPLGGAADRASVMLGNALVGNSTESVALEIALKGPTLRAETEQAGVVFGAPFTLSASARPLRPCMTFTLKPGEELFIGGVPRGVRAYLCVPGGFESPSILNSRSGLAAVTRGSLLACPTSQLRGRGVSPECFRWWEQTGPIRVVPGPQSDWFTAADFLDQEYRVSASSNRMGLRLEGNPLTMPDREMVSEPVCPGSVQVTRDGQCIILGVDGQTIGGYPKIAQVIAADLDRLGQLRCGTSVQFEQVTLENARVLYLEQIASLHEWLTRCQSSLVHW